MSMLVQKVGLEDSTLDSVDPATELTLQSVAGFNIPKYDYILASYPDSVTEVYTFYIGGFTGDIVGILIVVYTNSTKNDLYSVTKT